MKITNAMYLISSTKVKKARRALNDALPHFMQSEQLIGEILRDLPELEDRFFGTGEPILGGKKGFLVISGDMWWVSWGPWRCKRRAIPSTGGSPGRRSSPAYHAAAAWRPPCASSLPMAN